METKPCNGTKVSSFFHPANRPIDFLKSFFFISLLIRLGLELGLRLGVRVGVGFGLVT